MQHPPKIERPSPLPRRLVVLGLLALGLLLVSLAAWRAPWRSSPVPDLGFPLPTISESPYLNTRPGVRYVGSDTCRTCHEERHTTFRRTGMGRSMDEVKLGREPPDAQFDHPPSKRRYKVYRQDGQLRHRELLLSSGPEDVVLSDYPVKYVVGSGRHSLTYVVEAEGFLVESPVTWYRSRNGWWMSPGYDHPQQSGFDRAVGEGCLNCHAGRSEALGGSLHRMHVGEAAIGCERCHGPGQLHVDLHEGKRPAGQSNADLTIVNPARLPRDLAEAVCQQCHLRATATIPTRGMGLADFRPGLPLQDTRQDYALEDPAGGMTVVGHVEQMHLSKCYKASDSLTCVTCHDPHDMPGPKESVAYYKAVCLKCHPPASCKVTAERRAKESPENNCVHCHMPSAPTEIPHLAFTHHRIGLHDKRPAEAGQPTLGKGVLRPTFDKSRLSELDRKRSLGLGYLEAANREKNPGRADQYRRESLDLLTGVRAAGLREASVEASLARLRFDLGMDGVQYLAKSAADLPDCVGQDRCVALFFYAESAVQEGQHAAAAVALRELVRLRRHATDHLLLADCEKRLGNEAAVEEALTAAVRIDPRLWKIHRHLADLYRRKGDDKKAEWHLRRAVQ